MLVKAGEEVLGFALVTAVEAAASGEPGTLYSTVQRWPPSR
ncbi:hypothetical protein OG949_39885 [Streptomyces scopuliridis]|nr:hypothetical protein [Streptomyces scopuliridis]WSB38367.1 hypothetical protein OG949_39885 [Streptomyces scopuliridis]